jgi:hypothetical protein
MFVDILTAGIVITGMDGMVITGMNGIDGSF